MGELGGDGERKTVIVREREICKYIPGKHTQTKTTMIQKKLMLGSHKLHNPIFLTILMHFLPLPPQISHCPTGYLVIRFPCSALQWLTGASIPASLLTCLLQGLSWTDVTEEWGSLSPRRGQRRRQETASTFGLRRNNPHHQTIG